MARVRAGYLEMEMRTVETTISEDLKGRIAPDDMRAVYRAAFALHCPAGCHTLQGRRACGGESGLCPHFTLLASLPELPELNEALRQQLADSGLDPEAADAVFVTVAKHRWEPPIGPNHLAGHLHTVGIKPTDENMHAMARVIAAAYRNACLAATEGLDHGNPEAEIWPLPGALRKLLDFPAREPGHPAQPAPTHPPAAPATSPTAIAVIEPIPTRPTSKIDVPLSTLAATCLQRKIDDREWRDQRRHNIDAVVNLFPAANGDLMLSDRSAGAQRDDRALPAPADAIWPHSRGHRGRRFHKTSAG